MNADISDKLLNWISQSESWQAFVDFKLSDEDIADYTFLKRYEDFYITLYTSTIDLLKNYKVDFDYTKYISLAKGLDSFLLYKKYLFSGVNINDTVLLSATLHFICGFSSTAGLISNIVESNYYDDNELATFVLSIFRKEIKNSNSYCILLSLFLESADISFIQEIIDKINNELNIGLEKDFQRYIISIIAKALVGNFINNNIWTNLLGIENDLDFWAQYVSRNVNSRIWDFFPSQKEAIKKGLVSSTLSFSMQMPTSSGKTSLCELLIYYHFKRNPSTKIILLAPFRSLASELKITMGRRLTPYGIYVKALYGGSMPSIEEKISIEKANLLIITPEKVMAIEDIMPQLFDNVSLVICDEGHLIDDSNRGFDYELLITRLKILKGNDIRFIYLSAIIPNISDINNWLGGNENTIATSKYRPTIIEYSFIESNKKLNKRINKFEKDHNYFLNVNPTDEQPKNYKLFGFINKKEYQYINPETNCKKTYNYYSNKASLTIACALKSLNSGIVAVFTPTKGSFGVRGLCLEIIKQLSIKDTYGIKINSPIDFSNKKHLFDLVEYLTFLFSKDYLLVQCANNGFVYHHGSLPQFVRELIEDALRKEMISLLVCTNTLSEGINLPLKTIVIHSTLRNDGNEWKPLKIRDLKNLIGRVGRAGKEKSGLIIVPHSNDIHLIEKAINDIDVEKVKGFLFKIVKNINNFLHNHRLELTNEILESQDENFLRLVDSIDSAILDLVNEDAQLSDLNEIVQNLVENTFSFIQSNDTEKLVLKDLITLRSERIKEYLEDDIELKKLKRSGSNLRLFQNIINKVDFDNEIWKMEINPTDNIWIDFIFDQIQSIDSIIWEIENNNYDNPITIDILKTIAKAWMQGKQYYEIQGLLNYKFSIDEILDAINSFLCFKINNVVSKIIRIKEQSLDNEILNQNILDWPLFLQNGIDERIKLILLQLGFSERIGLWKLAEQLKYISTFSLTEEHIVKNELIDNSINLLDILKDKIPLISFDEIKNNLDYIKENTW